MKVQVTHSYCVRCEAPWQHQAELGSPSKCHGEKLGTKTPQETKHTKRKIEDFFCNFSVLLSEL